MEKIHYQREHRLDTPSVLWLPISVLAPIIWLNAKGLHTRLGGGSHVC